MSEEQRIHYFIPTLESLLRKAEQSKGAPLTKAEVFDIMDNATAIAVTPDIAREMDDKRGYRDINPDNCWEEWQKLRKRSAKD